VNDWRTQALARDSRSPRCLVSEACSMANWNAQHVLRGAGIQGSSVGGGGIIHRVDRHWFSLQGIARRFRSFVLQLPHGLSLFDSRRRSLPVVS